MSKYELSSGAGGGLLGGLSQAEAQAAARGLLELGRRQMALYADGDSSLREDTARELVESIEYTLGKCLNNGVSARELWRGDLNEYLAAGRRIIEQKSAASRELWQRACLTQPAFVSRSLSDTLRGIGAFWQRYDVRYFAHRIPCDIDYQLCVPVDPQLKGVDYIAEYLSRIAAENDFLCRFEAAKATRLLSAVVGDYFESVANLFEPVLTNAVGLALIGRGAAALDISARERSLIEKKLKELYSGGPQALSDAARAACESVGESGEAAVKYCETAARRLWPRAALALRRGGLEGLFPSFID